MVWEKRYLYVYSLNIIRRKRKIYNMIEDMWSDSDKVKEVFRFEMFFL